MSKEYLDNMVKYNNLLDISQYRCQDNLKLFDNGKDDLLTILSKKINIEPSVLTVYSNWIIYKNEFYYFKYRYCFEELLMGEIFKKYGIRNVEHQIVKNNDVIGIMSKNYRKPENEYIRYDNFIQSDDLNLPINLNILKDYLQNNLSLLDIEEFIKTATRIMAFDTLFGQIDRDYYNVYIEKEKEHYRIAPMFDNGLIYVETKPNDIYYHSCFQDLHFNNKKIDEKTLKVLIENPLLFEEFNIAMCIDIEKIYKLLEEKHELEISQKIRGKYIDNYDKNRRIAEKTLKLVR